MRIDGKKVLVTGGAQGIGFAIATRMAQAGATLIIADINRDGAHDAAARLDGTHHATAVDVTDEAQVRDMVEATVRMAGGLDVMVNCAGVTLGIRSIFDTSLADFERVQRINVTGTFLCCREAARPMVAQRSGSLITIASVTATLAQKGGVSYGTSKAAVAHLTRIVAMEMVEHGVRANAIAPGPVETPLMQNHGAARKAAYVARIPMGRVAQPSEIGGAALFLASDEASFVTGEVFHVDGGFSVSGLR
jgi:NAD(P)-dependent dehydrogenase (short-subunit alcohol dehydrogenase family)